MRAMSSLFVAFACNCSTSALASGEFDPDALSYSRLTAYFQLPDMQYRSARSTEAVTREADAVIVSNSRFFISQLLVDVPIVEMKRCGLPKPTNVYLVITLEDDDGRKSIYSSDGKTLFSADYRNCAEAPLGFLDRFDARPK